MKSSISKTKDLSKAKKSASPIRRRHKSKMIEKNSNNKKVRISTNHKWLHSEIASQPS